MATIITHEKIEYRPNDKDDRQSETIQKGRTNNIIRIEAIRKRQIEGLSEVIGKIDFALTRAINKDRKNKRR